ncbi:MAG: DUF1156 domain-containing protein [Chloroflexi bacterium]|nr:DUF1156 domain-containing protein [Chloroflexota bacterium]
MTVTPKKLIEVALPLPEINDASAYDKMPGIGPHPKGIHQWWARLPLPTARAVLFASVVDDPSEHLDRWPTEGAQNAERERLFNIVRKMMGKKLHEHPEIYAEARAEMLKHCDDQLPPLLDPFAGGGSIPLEGNRLGFDAHAGDLNPVAVLLNKCNLELAPRCTDQAPVNPEARGRIGGTDAWHGTRGLAADLVYYGNIIRERALSKIGDLYPKASLPRELGGSQATVIAWIWARTVASPDPSARGRHVPLVSSLLLSSKGRGRTWVELVLDESAVDGWRPEVRTGELSADRIAELRFGTKAGKAKDFICTLTRTPIARSYIQSEGKAGRLGVRLLALVADGGRRKMFLSANSIHEAVSGLDSPEVNEARSEFLSGNLPTRAEITGGVCTAYGLNTWGRLFTTRQLMALMTLSDLVQEVASDVEQDASNSGLSPADAKHYALSIVTFLALTVSRCADLNNSLCTWNPSDEVLRNLFKRQALPMVFDFAEANILADVVGGWSTCISRTSSCVVTMHSDRLGTAVQSDASASPIEPTTGALVSTDPPYYNNISYATLSDFFYVWLRRTIGSQYPQLFSTLFTPKLPELIASVDRFGGSRVAAKEHFETGFGRAFTSLRGTLDARFPLTVFYAFKQDDEAGGDADGASEASGVDLTTGWETLLEALISSGFQITATWPVRASQKWRMVSVGTNALASYIVLACRPRSTKSLQTDRRSFISELKRELPGALRHLQQGNVAPVDFAQAAIGPGMAIYSRYSRIIETNGRPMTVRSALSLINQTLTEVLTQEDDEFDAATRWALAWFDQHGFRTGTFGDAELLSKAKVTSIAALVQAGIISARAGEVRLLRPDELPVDWDPLTDRRLTVWEATHHLLRVYFHEKAGDEVAAALLRKIGTNGEIARDLAYRLFNVCEKRQWSQEAQAYNALVLGWPEVSQLAREVSQTMLEQASMFGRE